MNKKDICSYNYDELKEEMLAIGEKAFRSKQIYEWLHVKLADDFDEMTNLSKGLREKLKENYEIRKVKMIDHQISKVDPTEKFLFERQFCVYLFAGRMPYGVQVLCINDRRTRQESGDIGDAPSDLSYSEDYRRKSFQCGGYGNRRTVGQL